MGPLLPSIFGVGCLLLGILLNELLRRTNRIETYSKAIFDKRFSVYEGLWNLIHDANSIAQTVISDSTLSLEARHLLVSKVVLDIANYCDENTLYLNEEVTVQCCALYMGVEDIAEIRDTKERNSAASDFAESYRKAREMIRAEMGLQRLDGLFGKITKAKYSSTILQYFRHQKNKNRG